MQESVVRMSHISKSFGGVRVLHGVDLELFPGEVFALMGENGAGKSTLMNILSGAIPHYEGEIRMGGKKVSIRSPIEGRNLGVAKIHQELQLVPNLTVAENIFFGREPRNRAGLVHYPRMRKDAKVHLDALELDVNPRQQVRDLRVGEQQLVEIAKALSIGAKILIMDEPTSALSEAESHKLFNVVRKLKESGVSVIYITHRLEEVFEISDRVMVLRDGARIGVVSTAETGREEIIRMMVGRELEELFHKEAAAPGGELLAVEDLCFTPPRNSFKRRLDSVSLTLRQGEVLGIAGLMGSGRTELMECIFGVHAKHCTGSIRVGGEAATIRRPRDAIRLGVSLVTEDRKGQGLVLGRSIGENLSLPMLREFSRMYFMNGSLEKARWQEQMDALRIKAPTYATLVNSLSGGNQQKVALGKWLLTKPRVLLLDEPTRGIDVGAKSEVYRLIHRLAAEGMGIVVISSELPEILGLCDRILTFCEGRLTGEFPREEATQEKLLTAATMRR
ncbi:MAG: sugar ABC transporter ATP-binding protein [Clostridia bacterium]|nr:sugar ABC transporter ATP-binding protein [Clostridia bacterium]